MRVGVAFAVAALTLATASSSAFGASVSVEAFPDPRYGFIEVAYDADPGEENRISVRYKQFASESWFQVRIVDRGTDRITNSELDGLVQCIALPRLLSFPAQVTCHPLGVLPSLEGPLVWEIETVVRAGDGNDHINVHNGHTDWVHCGEGEDSVIVDTWWHGGPRDIVADDCENVELR